MQLPRPSVRSIAAASALAQFALHASVNAAGGYGYFRDELYYLACSARLAAGYVDLPPLSAHLLALQRALFGDGLFVLRLLPAVSGALVVYLTGTLAARLGTGRAGVLLACLACLCSPIVLAFTGNYSMNAFDLLVWTAAAHLVVTVCQEPRLSTWLALGLICGLGLLNKLSAAWLVAGIFVGLLATRRRNLLATPGPWLAAALALLLFAPFIAWNCAHDFAHLEFMRAASETKYAGLSAWTFLRGQLELHHPLNVLVWGAGLWFLLGSKAGAPYRPLGWIWLTACAVLVVHGHSKSEYLCAAFPTLFAAGGAASELVPRRWFTHGVRPIFMAALLATTVPLLPLVLPILPVESYVRYAALLGVAPDSNEGKELGPLPQHYADMFGWRAKAETVARAYARLEPEERAACAIFASNYGRCAAIDFFGDALGLPDSIGSHNNYWIWGPRGATGEIVLVLAADLGGREGSFASTEVVEQVPHDPYAMPYENDLKVFLCRGLARPLAELWPELRHYD